MAIDFAIINTDGPLASGGRLFDAIASRHQYLAALVDEATFRPHRIVRAESPCCWRRACDMITFVKPYRRLAPAMVCQRNERLADDFDASYEKSPHMNAYAIIMRSITASFDRGDAEMADIDGPVNKPAVFAAFIVGMA